MADPRPKCTYWDTCYRKNATHLAAFRHPRDDVADGISVAATPAPKPTLKAAAAVAVAANRVGATAKGKANKAEKKETEPEINEKKRARDSATPPDTDNQPPPPAATTKHTNTASAAPTPAAAAVDPVFDLKDAEIDAATMILWRSFHSGCWSSSCPVHSSASSPSSFFPLASSLLRSLYGGLEFSHDLFHLFEFAVRMYEKSNGGKFDIGEHKEGATVLTDAATPADATAAATDADAASNDPNSYQQCSWAVAANSLLHVFADLLHISFIGPMKILCGHFRLVEPTKLHPFILDRFFYDSPEVWSVIQQLPSHAAPSAASSSSAVASDPATHWAYYRDDPRSEFPATFIGRLTETSPAITLVGPNLLAALLAIIDDELDEVGAPATKKAKKDPNQTTLTLTPAPAAQCNTSDMTLESIRAELDQFGSKRGYTLTAKGGKRPPPKRDSAWIKREKKVVCDLDNKVGLVVPYADDIGWRPMNAESDELDKIVSDIEKAKYSGRKVNFDALDHQVTLVSYANDERDPGMGIELALNIMAKSKTNALNSDICRLLSLGYSLVDRPLYSLVIELSMRHRSKHIRQLSKGRFAKIK